MLAQPSGNRRDRVTMKKMTGGHVHGSDFVQTWKKNSIEEHRLQDKLRDLVAKRNSCIQHLCEKEKEVRLNVKLQGRHGTSRLPQQKSLESDVILTDTSFATYDRHRRASLQLDRQALSTIRSADVRTNDMNDPSSSSPSCHRRRFSLHHESASMGTWFGPAPTEHSTRDAGSRQRRGSLDGNIPSGQTFGSPSVRKQSLTHGFGLQKSMDTTSQGSSPSTPDSKSRDGHHFVFPPPSLPSSSHLRPSQTSNSQFLRDFSETGGTTPLTFSPHASGAYHFSRHSRTSPAKHLLPGMAGHRKPESGGNKMAIMHHVMQNSAIFAMAGAEEKDRAANK